MKKVLVNRAKSFGIPYCQNMTKTELLAVLEREETILRQYRKPELQVLVKRMGVKYSYAFNKPELLQFITSR